MEVMVRMRVGCGEGLRLYMSNTEGRAILATDVTDRQLTGVCLQGLLQVTKRFFASVSIYALPEVVGWKRKLLSKFMTE